MSVTEYGYPRFSLMKVTEEGKVTIKSSHTYPHSRKANLNLGVCIFNSLLLVNILFKECIEISLGVKDFFVSK